jgi:hypothetical protein
VPALPIAEGGRDVSTAHAAEVRDGMRFAAGRKFLWIDVDEGLTTKLATSLIANVFAAFCGTFYTAYPTAPGAQR